MRHGLAALVLAALLAPLVPAPAGEMVCCVGGGDHCACPVEAGFAKCQPARDVPASPLPPAIVPPPAVEIALAASFEPAPAFRETLVSLARPPLVPPPRA